MNKVLELALMHYGLREIPGARNNPTIMAFFTELEKDWVQNDETAWCSAFINALAKRAGYHYSGELDARSWLSVGELVVLPQIGDVVVLWREAQDSWKGHVGLYINHDEDHIYILGGNQSNSVNIKAYPSNRLLGYRNITKDED